MNTPWRTIHHASYLRTVKHKNSSPKQSKKAVTSSQPMVSADLNRNEIDLAPSADEVATRAYYNFVAGGSQPGNDLQHWLEAETQLLTERQTTSAHDYQDRT